MDARLDVHRLLGLAEGDAHVLRNAGATVTDDVIRSLAVSQRLLDTTDIMAISHTDCGMRTFSDEEFRSDLERQTGHRPPWPPVEFRDPEADVRASIVRISDSPFVPHTGGVRGFVFDVGSGRLHEITL
jgi:carbonic anhydrase